MSCSAGHIFTECCRPAVEIQSYDWISAVCIMLQCVLQGKIFLGCLGGENFCLVLICTVLRSEEHQALVLQCCSVLQ